MKTIIIAALSISLLGGLSGCMHLHYDPNYPPVGLGDDGYVHLPGYVAIPRSQAIRNCANGNACNYIPGSGFP